MGITSFLEGYISEQRVGTRYADGTYGPVAHITFDDRWLHITTDDHEGDAMLAIEALPHLIEALRRVAVARKTSQG